MSWYNEKGHGCDVVLSSRCRIARNISKLPMGERLSDKDAESIINTAEKALGKDYIRVDFSNLSSLNIAAYIEEHIISTDFANLKSPHTLFKNSGENTYIMVPEEDHFRIQSIVRGDNIEKAYKNALAAEQKLSEAFNFAFDEKLGYLTHCPTNLGSAMRISCMMFLPAVTKFGEMGSIAEKLQKLGFTVRGMYGEGSDAVGCLYQISNSVTLGIGDDEILEALFKTASVIADEERRLRSRLPEISKDELIDKVSRSYGTLTHSYLLSRKEFLSEWIELRNGISVSELTKTDMNIPNDITYEKLDSLLIEAQPSVLTLSHGGSELSPHEHDLYRAALVKERLS